MDRFRVPTVAEANKKRFLALDEVCDLMILTKVPKKYLVPAEIDVVPDTVRAEIHVVPDTDPTEPGTTPETRVEPRRNYLIKMLREYRNLRIERSEWLWQQEVKQRRQDRRKREEEQLADKIRSMVEECSSLVPRDRNLGVRRDSSNL